MNQIKHLINYSGKIIDLTEELDNDIDFYGDYDAIVKDVNGNFWTDYYEIVEIYEMRLDWETNLIDKYFLGEESSLEAENTRSDPSNFWMQGEVGIRMNKLKKILELESGIRWFF